MAETITIGEMAIEVLRKEIKHVHLSVHPPDGRVTLSAPAGTRPEAMRAFLEKHPVVYPVALVDVYAPPKDFEVPRGLPMTWLLAPDGKVARKFTGPVTAHDIEAAIAAAGGPAPG